MRVRPLCGQVLIQVLGPIPVSSVIETPDRHRSAEEVQEMNHRPTPPLPHRGRVLAIGQWKRLGNGLAVVPPISLNNVVLIRNGSGNQLRYGTSEDLRLVRIDDILAVVEEV